MRLTTSLVACFSLCAVAAHAASPRVVIVQPVVGNPLASGTTLRNAYAGVTTATPQYPVLIHLLPGTYDLGAAHLEMDKPSVYLSGSGRGVSIITSSSFVVLRISADTNVGSLTVENHGGDGISVQGGRVELKDLRVVSTRDDPNAFASAVAVLFGATGRMTDVLVEAANPSGNALGIQLLSQDPAQYVMDRATITAAGAAARGIDVGSTVLMNEVHVDSSGIGVGVIATGLPPTVTMTNCRIRGATQFGLIAQSNGISTITVQNSSITGSLQSISFPDSFSEAALRIASSLISGGVTVNPPNTLVCVGAYDGAFQPLDGSCQH